MAVRVDLNISLDGFATTTDQTPENSFGEGGPAPGGRVRRDEDLPRTAGCTTPPARARPA
jgi:hypothetical protein